MYVSDQNMTKLEQDTKTFIHAQQKQIFIPQDIQSNEPEEKIIGQYNDTYILIDTDEGLEIVDQHIAEERYIYEKLKSEKNVISQMLFVSDVIEISSTESSPFLTFSAIDLTACVISALPP